MHKLTVSRDDSVYEAFTDVAKAPDGTLVCTYRESMAHAPWPFSRVIVRRSEDGGYCWLGRQVLIEKDLEPETTGTPGRDPIRSLGRRACD